MKILAEKKALVRLAAIRDEFAADISKNYEHAAKSCITCDTPGACCLDAHFVNVHITPLEAIAIGKVIDKLPDEHRRVVRQRVADTVSRFGLDRDGDTFSRTYACPLYEKGIGCLVHHEAKPLPCIQHACYENAGDLPPDALQTAAESQVARLNELAYGRPQPWLPLPVAIS
jgi:hypothetical protein